MDWLPTAVRDPKGRVLTWSKTTDPKGCLHTTETSGWPGYDSWTVHPHATIMPVPNKGITVRQNVPFSRASFSLRNLPGGVQTNRDYVYQFELIGTCVKNGPGYFWPDADDDVLLALYDEVIEPLSESAGIPIRAQPFQAYPASYGPRGNTNTVRMSGADFDTYSGWLGHENVPENTHGDPGAFPWARMMRLVQERGEMQLSDKVELSIIAAREMSQPGYTPRAPGDELSLSYLFQWGGPGMYRLTGKVDTLQEEISVLRATLDRQTTLIEQLIGLLSQK